MALFKTIKNVLKHAHELINSEEAKKEAEKKGILRAGSCGALEDGQAYYAQCGRLAQARLLGEQSQPTEEMRIMFNNGITLEEYLAKRFEVMKVPFVREREISKEVEEGLIISGRPDFILYPDDKEAITGVEVKSLASPFTVTKHAKNKMPLMKHLLQACTYMLLTDMNEWLIVIGHTFYVNERGFKVEPKLSWYRVEYRGGRFFVTNEEEMQQQLPFDKTSIIAYYKEVRKSTEARQLMQRPTERELASDSYDRCKYCPMQSACNEYDNKQISFEAWLERIKYNKERN